MFVFFSNKLGCLGSILVSLVGTIILLAVLHVIQGLGPTFAWSRRP